MRALPLFNHRYAAQIHKKLDVFWPLSSDKILGIMNALPMAESLAQLVEDAGPDGKDKALEVWESGRHNLQST